MVQRQRRNAGVTGQGRARRVGEHDLARTVVAVCRRICLKYLIVASPLSPPPISYSGVSPNIFKVPPTPSLSTLYGGSICL